MEFTFFSFFLIYDIVVYGFKDFEKEILMTLEKQLESSLKKQIKNATDRELYDAIVAIVRERQDQVITLAYSVRNSRIENNTKFQMNG